MRPSRKVTSTAGADSVRARTSQMRRRLECQGCTALTATTKNKQEGKGRGGDAAERVAPVVVAVANCGHRVQDQRHQDPHEQVQRAAQDPGGGRYYHAAALVDPPPFSSHHRFPPFPPPLLPLPVLLISIARRHAAVHRAVVADIRIPRCVRRLKEQFRHFLVG